jgi:diguanylate cyclase (GGDEF)-like protein
VVLDNASQAKQFQKDPYIIAHQPKSVLCVPLQYQGNLRAIAYLENNLTTMAFTRDRVEMVKLLCAQAAISLENAQLYTEQAAYTHQLEERVAERTAELEQVNHELQQLANLDGLTQLANRRRFDECLTQEWKLLAREQQSLTLVLCDVDHFKEYNDCYGHQQGDDCLKQIANVLRRVATRPADLVARYGGEEFVLILPGTDENGARSVSERIQQEIRQLRLTHARSEVAEFVTLSLGVASIIPSLDVAPEILIKHADTALYEAKRRGRDRSIYLSVSNS